MRTSMHVIAMALTLTLAAPPVLPAGTSTSSSRSTGSTSSSTTRVAPVDPDFKAGVEAWKAKQWQQVQVSMSAVVERDANNADAWNYLGHAARQLGDLDTSLKHYDRALQINPNHRGAHEYLGEAYLQLGQLDKAEAHLKVLDKLCWLPCEEFTDLKEAVARYRREHPGG